MLFIVSALLFVGKIVCVDEKCFQDFRGITNDCSVPIFKDFPYKVTFRPACQRHDLCYGCVRHYHIFISNKVNFAHS